MDQTTDFWHFGSNRVQYHISSDAVQGIREVQHDYNVISGKILYESEWHELLSFSDPPCTFTLAMPNAKCNEHAVLCSLNTSELAGWHCVLLHPIHQCLAAEAVTTGFCFQSRNYWHIWLLTAAECSPL